MDVKQIYNLVNDATSEVLGEALLQEDLGNLVDVGDAVFNANAYDKYVKSLVNHIGKVVFVNRKYSGGVPSVLMDGWEYGSVMEKIATEMPQATVNESWELVDGASYDPNIFHAPKVEAKFFNSKVTFEVELSITENQVKQSFSNATQLNAFVSMLYNSVDKSLTVKTEALIMRTINNFIGETIHNGVATRAVNLLTMYNNQFGQTLTADKAIFDLGFQKFATYIIAVYKDRISKMSTLFNIGGKERFTTKDYLHIVMLSDFYEASSTYLQADTYHKELVALPNGIETVPYWQGSGATYSFRDISSVIIKTSSGDNVTRSGILCVMFDRDALGVCNVDRRVTTNYNPKAEFYNNFYKFDAMYFNDFNENFVVFYVG